MSSSTIHTPMHPYCKHLLNDIAQAHRINSMRGVEPPTPFAEAMEEAEQWEQCSRRQKTFGECCGLQAGNFPPPGHLTTSEMRVINEAFLQMMATYNLDPCLPQNLPPQRAYSLLVNLLNEKMFLPPYGPARFDYCTGYPPDCIFEAYCKCLSVWNSLPETDPDMFASGTRPG